MATSDGASDRAPKGILNLWCSHCETAFRGEFAEWLSRKPIVCPHCGSRHRLLPWEQIRCFRPDYPRKPEYGRTYSLNRVSYR
jgi:DNA-directed RNA polymerase subunit RPC12/RpoP